MLNCSAGDAHSGVLMVRRDMQYRDYGVPASVAAGAVMLSTFGRGAHGRLGNGSNRVRDLDWFICLDLSFVCLVYFDTKYCARVA